MQRKTKQLLCGLFTGGLSKERLNHMHFFFLLLEIRTLAEFKKTFILN